MTILLYVVLAVAALFAGLFVYTVRKVRRIEAALPPTGRFVDVPGARLHVVERDEVLEIVFGPDPVPADFAVRGGGMLALRPSHFVAASEDLVAGAPSLAPLVARYGELRLPVSILFGREDRILDPAANGEAMVAKVPGATLALVPGGHMLPIMAADTCVAFVRAAAARLREAEAVTA
ncbi:hypothetical protein LMG23992_01210 [Cupriavidus laharis]|uniref:Alpha/beta hydrolase n=1 Tax=Cupriavidus laharis TaxID=151654 RepID=A0ABM8WMI1_9BURK|nr:hypothetical protein [Cupriavidus laharis]CAG9168598.1 hypothetical protein LMG23992_01210 [Cupriavidus laharis]